MSIALLLPLLGIALIDSFNPSLFIAQFILLATLRPTVRVITYIAGLLVVNFAAGLLLFTGVQAVIGQFFTALPATTWFIGQAIIGALLLITGIVVWRKWQTAPPASTSEGIAGGRQPGSLHPVATFGFGMVVMINEMTTALPMFAAVERMNAAGVSTGEAALLLVAYNIVFALPLFGFLAAYLKLRQRFTDRMDAISRGVRNWSVRITIALCLVIGVIALADALPYFIVGSPLFVR